MMSCLWILVFGSLIATGVRTQEGEAEGSEEANTSAVTTDQHPAQAEDSAVSEDGGDGSPEPMSEGDETTAAPETADEPVTDVPEMDITTEETGLNQENLTPVIAEDPQGGEPHPTEGDSGLTVSNTPSPPEEGETKSAEEQFSANEVSAGNDIADADSLSEGAGKVRSAGAKAEPKGLGSGAVAGVVVAIGVAIIAAFSSYLTYQKKMLCFKVQGRDPERAKEENPTQNDPQALSSLLNSP